MATQVLCVTKYSGADALYRYITHIGGKNSAGNLWRITEEEAIAGIKGGQWAFYVSVNGKRADVVIASNERREYLKTEADGYIPNNLLSLPACP